MSDWILLQRKLLDLIAMIRRLWRHLNLARLATLLSFIAICVLLLQQPSAKVCEQTSQVIRGAGPASSSHDLIKDCQLANLKKSLYHRVNNLNMLDYSGDYYILEDFLSSASDIAHNSSDITLTSLCTSNHMHYVLGLSELWEGPISIAVFTYDADFLYTLKLMLYYIYCYQAQVTRVTFHLIFPKRNYPANLEALIDKATSRFRCSEPPVSSREGSLNFVFKSEIQLPINLARNVAITGARSRWIFQVDIDFLPSIKLHQTFKRLVESNDRFRESSLNKLIFIVPAFERKLGKPVPKDKADLLLAWKRKDVRQYHYYAPLLHKPTNYSQWLQLQKSESLQVSYSVQYDRMYEPFFLAQLPFPLFDERFRQFGFDRTSQTCEMFVAGFKFLVLNNAFVVHDGFKGSSNSKTHRIGNWNWNKNLELDKIYEKFQTGLKQKYPDSPRKCMS